MTQETSTEIITHEKYKEAFKGKEAEALKQALDIRKFEIELYWKRATYFWTFIGATMAGFLAIQASSAENKQDLAVILACLGIVFSFAWVCVNRGSKFWQENWEKHVDVLEDEVTGPLYKTVMSRNSINSIGEKAIHLITGPSYISVSKINQIISIYVSILWIILLFYSLPEFRFKNSINWFYVALTALSILICLSFVWLGRSYGGGYFHEAKIRKSRVKSA
ncbi:MULTISPECIES: hypothetical protein [unclassified Comamonas]|uniref:RipA family octameric membrane protein n=1 Tax=unclassified Comamonas TaxID=2638500 RepID=UPI001FA6EAE1|nr:MULTISPECIES: hypothetical protein [unclassified Comamonas]UNV89545.1 hypothetical protein MP576_18340 [Comamonas sp. 7D-2evo1]UNV97156.1 hypothetical protein MPZ60_08065 [Comamonas sp. 7D-2]UNV99190.1 hypothetical protein MP579_18345 [Comamonas sp. 7D-2evo2]